MLRPLPDLERRVKLEMMHVQIGRAGPGAGGERGGGHAKQLVETGS